MTAKKQNEITSVNDEKLVSFEEEQTVSGSNEEIKIQTVETESLVTSNDVLKTRH